MRRDLIALTAVTGLGAAFRFYGLENSAPYHEFHIDEHFVFKGADLLRESQEKAAMSPKFFMYGPLPMYLLNILRGVYEFFAAPLTLSVAADGKMYMLMGRSISALLGTLTIPLVWLIAFWSSGRTAALVAAGLMACAVLSLRDSHFFTVDTTLVFFCMLTWAAALAISRTGKTWAYVAAGVAFGAAVACKYSAVFLAPVILVAHVCSPTTPRTLRPLSAWLRTTPKGLAPLLLAGVVFLMLDPMILMYFSKFKQDVGEQITGPLLGGIEPLYNANFRDIQPQSYWFTNLLPWGIGPAFAIWGLAGVAWLLTRKTKLAFAVAAYPVIYYAFAGQTVTPFMRYSLPLIPALAVAAGALSADLMGRPRWRLVSVVCTALVLLSTSAYALAYMKIYADPDVRLQASAMVKAAVPKGAAILIEPSHNVPPTGSYLDSPSFYSDYVLWGRSAARFDYYTLHPLDVYDHLYDGPLSPADKKRYIEGQLARVDYVLMDDTFLELYEHLSGPEYAPVKDYYRDLFNGRLGFQLAFHLKPVPSLFGLAIDDQRAEFSFSLFDHPEIFLFKRWTVRDVPVR